MRVVLMAGLFGACAPTPKANTAAPPQSNASEAAPSFFDQLDAHGLTFKDPRVTGRVLLDGDPVHEFSVTLSRDATFLPALGTFERPIPIHATNGRFSIKLTDESRRDIIIAGRGFKRHIIRRADMKDLGLGDISVSREHRFEGIVRDLKGAPVSNAWVTFSPTSGLAARSSADDELTDLVRGKITVRTDSDGHYVIEGAAPSVRWSKFPNARTERMELRAWADDHRSSYRIRVADADSRVDITIVPTGTLEVSTRGIRSDIVFARPANADVDMVMRASQVTDQANRFEELPAGEYVLMRSAHYLSEAGAQRVVVTPDALTTVQLDP
jgi:hypothetical protein